MKFICLPLFLILCWSCGGDSPADATDEVATTESTESAATVTKAPAQIDQPCDVVSWAEVSSVFGWSGTNESRPITMRDGMLKSCYYSSPTDEGNVTISITQIEEQAISNKYLEKTYAKNLTAPNGPLKYEEVTTDLGDQSIFGSGKNGPNFTYQLSWRAGNEVDYSVVAKRSEAMDAAVVLPKLKALAEKL